MIYSERFLNIFNRFVFTVGRIFQVVWGLWFIGSDKPSKSRYYVGQCNAVFILAYY